MPGVSGARPLQYPSATRWLVHASPVIQVLLGWPWVVVVEVPLPLLLLGGGVLAMRL